MAAPIPSSSKGDAMILPLFVLFNAVDHQLVAKCLMGRRHALEAVGRCKNLDLGTFCCIS